MKELENDHGKPILAKTMCLYKYYLLIDEEISEIRDKTHDSFRDIIKL